jgi:hypothetical protein
MKDSLLLIHHSYFIISFILSILSILLITRSEH